MALDVHAALARLREEPLAIVVLGASGDLAHKKTFPSLLGLFARKLLPPHVRLYGYARTAMTVEQFRESLTGHLPEAHREHAAGFLERCTYVQGSYDSAEDMARLGAAVRDGEAEDAGRFTGRPRCNRLFYLALPPSVYAAAAGALRASAFTDSGWNRVVVEKPFGRDLGSSAELSRALGQHLREEEVYRIDHYLGKEMVQNLMVLRFANRVFEPLWSAEHVSTVQITFKEPFGAEGRAGYFEQYGIIRDVLQNHLMQVLSLVAMDPPASLHPEHVRDSKVRLLRAVRSVEMGDVVLGQYGRSRDGAHAAYAEDPALRGAATRTPTFALAVLHVDNDRWRGVPFILKAGKALNERKAEVRIQFRPQAAGLYGQCATQCNELVLRIQPGEAVYLKMMCKSPGLTSEPVETELDLSYRARYPRTDLPDAYERLLLDVLRGDQSHFVREDELTEAWRVFTPLLQQIEEGGVEPVLYPYGSRGPPEADDRVRAEGYRVGSRYRWSLSRLMSDGVSCVDALVRGFTLGTDALERLARAFQADMLNGLAGEVSTMKMIPSFVTGCPSGREQGTIWAVDIGGTNFRVAKVVLGGSGSVALEEFKTKIPEAYVAGTAEELFGFMADHIVAAVGVTDEPPLGFTFSFPVDQTGIASGRLMEWTKDFTTSGVTGEDVVALLQRELDRRGARVRVTALVNDTVGTLMSAAYDMPRCCLGVILGTGTNAAYVERADRIPKWRGAKEGLMVINMEWGGFGSSEGDCVSDVLPQNEVDAQMDAGTKNRGRQLFEKMISGRYLGELARISMAKAEQAGELWHSATRGGHVTPLDESWGVDTGLLSSIEEDDSADLRGVRHVVEQEWGMHGASADDLHIVRRIAHTVALRSARLSATGVAAVLRHMRETGALAADARPVVGVDGSLFKLYPGFRDAMAAALGELGADCELALAEDGSGKGAAIVAAVMAAPAL